MAGRGLSYKAELDTTEALKKAKEFNRELAKLSKMSVSPSGGLTTGKTFDVKPLTAFQQGILKIKQETLDLAKVKQAQAQADKSASLVTQEALKQERLALIALKAEQKAKKPTQISNSQAEIDAYNNVANGSSKATLAINEQNKAQAQLANSAVAVTTATANQGKAVASTNLSRKQAAKLLAEEKYIQAQATRELKNNIREQLNAKGSLEQRRAALIRLNIAYDRLSVSERNSAAGQRLKGIVSRTTDQLKNLEDATGRAQRKVGDYTGAFSKGLGKVWGGLKLIANILPGLGLAGLLGFAIEPILDYIKTLDIFKKTAKSIISDTAIDSSEYKEAVTSVTSLKGSIDEYHKGIKTGKEVVKEYNDNIGKTAGLLKNVSDVEDFYNSKADDFVEAMFLRSQAQAALAISTEALLEAQKRASNDSSFTDYLKAFGEITLGGGFGLGGITNLAADNKQTAVDALTKKGKDAIVMFEKLQKESDKFNKSNGFKFDGSTATGTKAMDAAINSRNSLQSKIDALTKRGVDKQLSEDQQEIEAVKAKYKILTDEAIKFNNNKENIKKGLKVDAGGLKVAQKTEEADITYKQDTAKIQERLAKEKVLYDEFEAYKLSLGTEKAKELYNNRIDVDKRYLKQVQEELEKMPVANSAGEKARFKLLSELAAAEIGVNQKKQNDLLAEFTTYADKRKKLEEKYQEDIALMHSSPKAQELRTAKHKTDLEEQADAQAKSLDAYKALFDGVDKLSDDNAKNVIANAQAMLSDLVKTGGISKDLAEEIAEMIGQSTVAIKQRLPDGLINLANQIDFVADSVGGVDTAFGKVLHTLGNVVGQVGNIKKGIAEFNLAQGKGDILGGLSAGLGIFGAGLSIVSSVNTFLDRQTQADKERADSKRVELRQTEALTKALERQLEVAGKTYGTEKIKEYRKAIEEANKTINETTKALSTRKVLTDDSELNELIEKVNNGEKLSNWSWWGMTDKERYKYASKNLKTVTTDVKELQSLLEGGKLDANTAKLAESYLNAIKSIEEAGNAVAEFVTGSTFDSLADSIVDMFAQGTTSAEDFAGNFEEIMKKAIMNSFKTKLLTDQLQAFYKDFASFSESGGVLTSTEIGLLKDQYDKVIKEGQEKFAELGKITGMDLTKPSSGSTTSTLQGDIKSITTEQAGVLTGTMNGIRLATLDGNRLLTEGNKVRFDAYSIAKGSFDVAVKIEQNTANTVVELKNAVVELKSINRKTGSDNAALKAAGR